MLMIVEGKALAFEADCGRGNCLILDDFERREDRKERGEREEEEDRRRRQDGAA